MAGSPVEAVGEGDRRSEAIHRLPASQAHGAAGSSPAGLCGEEAARRLSLHGPNELARLRTASLPRRLLGAFTHLMALLLWAGGAIALLAGLPQLAAAIWGVVLLNGAFGFWQEHKAEKAVEALRRVLPSRSRAIRDGREILVETRSLVPGDVVRLSEGDRVPADARVVEETSLRVDQSTLTGESHPVRKGRDPFRGEAGSRAEIPNLVFAGTVVAAGDAVAVVFATGMGTEFGKIASLTQEIAGPKSPLQRELERATRVVTAVAVGTGAAFFPLAVGFAGMDTAEGFLFALGMIVAFVPEGLLPTVTLALAMGVQRMARRKALVKRLSAVETLGCTSVICTDKTGTLTRNEMTVTELWSGGVRMTASGGGYGPGGEILRAGARRTGGDDPSLRRLLVAAGLCNNARVIPAGEEGEGFSVLGDPTEGALRVVAGKGGVDLEREERRRPRLAEIPFDPVRRRMSTVHREGASRVAFVKGAPGELLGRCSRILSGDREVPLDAPGREEVGREIDRLAKQGLRVLGAAERTLADGEDAASAESVERDLTFLGLLAMTDPPRPEVEEAVRRCHRAGIRVVMITGDYALTAESVARRIGILRTDRPRILNGREMDGMTDAELSGALREEVILARASPEHKLRAVRVLRSQGHVVAVTGDGVNDAPALKEADIGVAMGRSGTDVAREAADMVLADDHFASIVNAVEEGRAVYANIRKFIGYIFTSNTPEAVPFILHALSGGRIPLALDVLLILSVDLGTDIVPALALGAEPPEPGIMDRPPRSLREHAITARLLLRAYPFLGLIQAAAVMAAFFFPYWRAGYAMRFLDLPAEGALAASARAMALGAVVFTQVGNLFAQRTERASVFGPGFFANRLVWAGIGTELLLLVSIAELPVLQRIFGTASIPGEGWLFLLALTPALLAADEARKALVRRGAKRTDPCLTGRAGDAAREGGRP